MGGGGLRRRGGGPPPRPHDKACRFGLDQLRTALAAKAGLHRDPGLFF